MQVHAATLGFYVDTEDPLRFSLSLHSKHFTGQAISLILWARTFIGVSMGDEILIIFFLFEQSKIHFLRIWYSGF